MQKHKKARGKVKGNTEGTPNEGAIMMKAREWKLISLKTSTQTPLPSHSNLTTSLVDPKNLETLEAMGGIDGLMTGLGVDSNSGLGIGGRVL